MMETLKVGDSKLVEDVLKAVKSKKKSAGLVRTAKDEIAITGTYWEGGSRNTWYCIEQFSEFRGTRYVNQLPQYDPPQYGGPANPTCRLTDTNLIVCVSTTGWITIYQRDESVNYSARLSMIPSFEAPDDDDDTTSPAGTRPMNAVARLAPWITHHHECDYYHSETGLDPCTCGLDIQVAIIVQEALKNV